MRKLILFALFIGASCHTANAQYTSLLNFAGTTNGSNPQGSLFSDGAFLYGMTAYGGIYGAGVIFKIKPDGTGYAALHFFDSNTDGGYPFGSLISDGTFLYGTTTSGGTNYHGTVFKIKPDGTGYSILHNFTNSGTDGGSPYGSLSFDGTFLYGMTVDGATIFKIKPDGTGYSILYMFQFGTGDGWRPYNSLISDSNFFYGMTWEGGINNYGTIFKIKPDGTGYAKLLDFDSINGSSPYGSLISIDTFLYGMTRSGGINDKGVIFKIKSDGLSDTVLFNFGNGTDGAFPYGGSLYYDGTFLFGMTTQGGTNGNGVLFKIKPDGTSYTKLREFTGISNQFVQIGGSLISDGMYLFGMTMLGGFNNIGTVFKYNPYCTPVTFTKTDTLCAGQSITVGSHSYTTTGTYTDVLIAASTCDSIVTTQLTVNDVSVSVSNTTLTANSAGATYQWINCNNGNIVIAGQTNQSYTTIDSGSYAVIVTQNSCSDTSSCYHITFAGTTENIYTNEITVSPNPSGSQTIISFTKEQKNTTIKIIDVFGNIVKTINFCGKQLIIEKGEIQDALYFVQIQTIQGTISKKLIITK